MHDREACGEEGNAELILVIRKPLVGGPRVRYNQEGADAAAGGWRLGTLVELQIPRLGFLRLKLMVMRSYWKIFEMWVGLII